MNNDLTDLQVLGTRMGSISTKTKARKQELDKWLVENVTRDDVTALNAKQREPGTWLEIRLFISSTVVFENYVFLGRMTTFFAGLSQKNCGSLIILIFERAARLLIRNRNVTFW